MDTIRAQRILAIDVGSVRVGLALSDELLLTAQPLDVLPRRPQKKLIQQIKEIVKKNNVGTVVVGLPLNLKGEETLSTTDARQFAERLKRNLPDVQIILWDERMTTSASESLL
ncbi:Holliday junction resolvase RuvX, partial [Candidatus Sumerlaeota bacterium]|nr:Holliday junction resolvase RuvX [Candidatus Sumerlaeota bacterium]